MVPFAKIMMAMHSTSQYQISFLGVVANQKSLTKEEQSYITIKRDDIEYEVEFPQV